MTIAPRSHSGARFHEIGTDVYAVALDTASREASARHYGHAWVAVEPDGGAFMFVDDHGGASSRFIATRDTGDVAKVGVFIDGDLANLCVCVGGGAAKGSFIDIDWSPMYETMR